jgi:hypothetical protein
MPAISPRVLADLVLGVHQHPDQIENGVVGEVPNTDLSHVARHPLNDSIGHAADRSPGLNTTGSRRYPRVTEFP